VYPRRKTLLIAPSMAPNQNEVVHDETIDAILSQWGFYRWGDAVEIIKSSKKMQTREKVFMEDTQRRTECQGHILTRLIFEEKRNANFNVALFVWKSQLLSWQTFFRKTYNWATLHSAGYHGFYSFVSQKIFHLGYMVWIDNFLPGNIVVHISQCKAE